MPVYLVVLGTGQWGYGSPTKSPKMQNFPAHGSPYLADEEVQHFVRRAQPHRQLVLIESDAPPEIVRQPALNEPLKIEHLHIPAAGSVSLAAPEVVEEMVDTGAVPLGSDARYPCPACNDRYPSRPALARHAEFEHGAPPPFPLGDHG